MKYFIFISFILGTTFISFGDQPRNTREAFSPTKEYVLKYERSTDSTEKWILRKAKSGELIYELDAEYIWSHTLLISDNGRFVAIVDDYSMATPANALPVISFYTDGVLIQSHTLGELLENLGNVSHSVSHFRWVHMYEPEPNLTSKSLTVKTYEGTQYEFNLEDGSIRSRTHEPLRDQGAVYVYGDIQKFNGNRYKMDIWHRVWGELPDDNKIVFTVNPSFISPDPYRGHAFKTGGVISCVIHKEEMVYKTDISFNECNVKNRN